MRIVIYSLANKTYKNSLSLHHNFLVIILSLYLKLFKKFECYSCISLLEAEELLGIKARSGNSIARLDEPLTRWRS